MRDILDQQSHLAQENETGQKSKRTSIGTSRRSPLLHRQRVVSKILGEIFILTSRRAEMHRHGLTGPPLVPLAKQR
jgi:hypothetical protein